MIAENLEAAFGLKTDNPALGVATLAGEFISREGIIRGGRTGENSSQSALARRAQLSHLDRELAAVIRKLESQTAARAEALQALEVSQDLLLAARERFQRAQVESASIQSEQKLAERQLVELENRRATFAQETVQIGELLRASLSHLEHLESAIADNAQSLEQSRTRRTQAELDAHVARERENAVVDDLNEIRVRVATERQQQEDLNRQRGPMAARLAELAEVLETRRADIAGYESRIQTLETECHNLGESIAEWRRQSASLEKRIAELASARGEVHDSAEALEVALRSARQQLIQLQEQKGRLEVRLTQVDMRMENLRNHVSHRYQVDLEAFEPDSYALITSFRERRKKKVYDAQAGSGDPTFPEPSREDPSPVAEDNSETIHWDHIEEIVADLTERIDAMGPVNLDAIQEYDELEQRHTFLEKQNADLVNSKAELLEVITKINRTTQDALRRHLRKNPRELPEMFTELFGGGKANLMLTDESDPLESGIEIIAKPPGKQLQSISLLSGGERTMTAVALLFSIYMVKPSARSACSTKWTRRSTNRTSTASSRSSTASSSRASSSSSRHNKRTIARADALYGVTMEEHGVSKIVSVKFTTKEEASAAARRDAQDFGGSRNFDRNEEPATT